MMFGNAAPATLLKSPREIEIMGRGGAILHATLMHAKAHVRPGISTMELDTLVEGFIREHPDAGIRFVRNDRNLGVSGSFAKALAMAQGEALFMMAGDDVSDPGRLERSLAYLETHPSAMALVTNADIIDERSLPQGCLDNCAAATESVSLSLAGLRPGEYFLRGR
ncbi:MAG: glycosyltransferase, partial [Gemmatimonadaceae bacterium]|nr:glycosyltransferase [Gemmatimonadaceae bacterium]